VKGAWLSLGRSRGRLGFLRLLGGRLLLDMSKGGGLGPRLLVVRLGRFEF